MRRFSLFHLVICLPVFAGLAFAFYSYRVSSILTRFNDSLEYDRMAFKYSDLASAFGESKARKIVGAKAMENDKLFFDEESRIVQIVRRNKYTDKSDTIALKTFGKENGNWIGPNGMHVASVSFSNNAILIDVFGNMKWKSHSISIAENEKLTVSIPWAKNGKPTHGDLSTDILVAFVNNGGTIQRTADR